MMKFVVGKKKLFWWPVVVTMPSDTEIGQTETQELEVQFEALSHDEAKAIDVKRDSGGISETIDVEHAVLTRVVQGWRGVVGEDGAPLEFTPQNFLAAIGYSWTRKGLYAAYAQAMAGEAARTKN